MILRLKVKGLNKEIQKILIIITIKSLNTMKKPLYLCALSLSSCGVSIQNHNQNQPNIVLILVDDMGFSDLGCYGSEIHTPNIDFLAENGVRFNQFTNASKSFPSRACLLTGLYAQQCGMAQRPDTIRNAVTIAEVLKANGYRTLMSGKHHGKENLYNRGFDRCYGLKDGACNHFNPGLKRDGEPEPAHKVWAAPRKWCIDDSIYAPYNPVEKDFYTTDYFCKQSLIYLDTYKNEEKPFFLYLSFTAPHDPLHAWPEDIAKYEGVYDSGYKYIRQRRYDKMQKIGIIDESFPISEDLFSDWDTMNSTDKKDEIRRMQVYAAMIDRVDQKVGELIRKLKETGAYDNTVFIFSSDNGGSMGMFPIDGEGYNEGAGEGEIGTIGRWASVGFSWANVSNTPFRFFKNWSHHGGVCSPFIVYYPNKIKPKITSYPGHFIDIMPTIIDLSGSKYPKKYNGKSIPNMEGESLLPVLFGDKKTRSNPIFWNYQNGKAVRTNNFRLVWESNTTLNKQEEYSEGPDNKEGEWKLYDMRNDKTETVDVSQFKSKDYESLKKIYEEWNNEMLKYIQLDMVEIRK